MLFAVQIPKMLFLTRLHEYKERAVALPLVPVFALGFAAAAALAKWQSFTLSFYVMGEALSDELFCTLISLVGLNCKASGCLSEEIQYQNSR